MIGWAETTVQALLSNQPIRLNDRPGGSTPNPGTLAVSTVHITRYPKFLDYIAEGCELTVTCAVDFTASNGDPTSDPQSLHAMVQGSWNQYQQVVLHLSHPCPILIFFCRGLRLD